MNADEPSEILDADETDETIDHESEIPNETFINPSQVENKHSNHLFICEICDFASARKDTIENHKELIHNWCPQCCSSFEKKNKLKKHFKDVHSTK